MFLAQSKLKMYCPCVQGMVQSAGNYTTIWPACPRGRAAGAREVPAPGQRPEDNPARVLTCNCIVPCNPAAEPQRKLRSCLNVHELLCTSLFSPPVSLSVCRNLYFATTSTRQRCPRGAAQALLGAGRTGSSQGAGRKAALPDDPTTSRHSSSALENQCLDPADSWDRV